MLKHFFSTLLGLLVGMMCVPAIAVISQKIWPPPAGITSASDKDALRAAVASMPTGALITVAGSWLVGAFVGGLLASKLSGSPVPAYVVGGFVALAAISSLLTIPYPVWFWPVALVLVPLASYAAAWIAARGRPARHDAATSPN